MSWLIQKRKISVRFYGPSTAFQWSYDTGLSKASKCLFSPSGDKVYFNAYFNHEKNDEKFGVTLSIPGFHEFLTVVEEMANTPFVIGQQNEKIVSRQGLYFFKDGKFNHGGTELGLVRNEEGLIYLLVKNKKIPSIPFDFLPQGDYGWTDSEEIPACFYSIAT